MNRQLAGVQNYIVAADGRNHTDCKTKFHLKTKDDDEKLKEIDHGFSEVARKIWTSAKLQKS